MLISIPWFFTKNLKVILRDRKKTDKAVFFLQKCSEADILFFILFGVYRGKSTRDLPNLLIIMIKECVRPAVWLCLYKGMKKKVKFLCSLKIALRLA